MSDPLASQILPPERYIEKVSLATAEVIDEPIKPEELLVRKHRDYHVVDIYARHLMSVFVKATGDEEKVRRSMKRWRRLGWNVSEKLARVIGVKDPQKVSKLLFGLKEEEHFFRYKREPYTREQIEQKLKELKADAVRKLEGCRRKDGSLALRVLLTGGTGFVGKEILWQAARDPDIAEMVVLIRPKTIRDRKTGKVVKQLTPEDRGRELLAELWLDTPEHRSKYRFVAGDIEEPQLGVGPGDYERLRKEVTHVVHCAASVAFDSPYEESFVANVLGTLNALTFAHSLQSAADSPFVAHVAIETSYIHGRQSRQHAREDEVVFPRNFYNNYYELTKAMASIETERFMLDKGLRVVQLCPAIVIGDARTGNNRGDTKVVNAPVNAFGRARQALKDSRGDWLEFSKTWVLFRMASIFPGDPSAELNLIPVDWVARGILHALSRPQSVGERVHLATDNRITAERMRAIITEELQVDVKLAEPTLHRNLQLPVITGLLKRFQHGRLAQALEKLGAIFGGYSEWGQPVHEVGHDVTVLGMPEPRPNTEAAFRMLCRHNKLVQRFGVVREGGELSRRERLWNEFIDDLEQFTGKPAGSLPAADFRQAFYVRFDPESFQPKSAAGAVEG